MKTPRVKLTYSHPVKAKDREKLDSPSHIAQKLREIYDPETIEHTEKFYVLLFDRSLRLIGYEMLSSGGVDSTVLDLRVLLQIALLCNSHRIIISHNHPSGNVLPSAGDKKMTKQAQQALDLVGIQLMDHIIMTADYFYSFANEGEL